MTQNKSETMGKLFLLASAFICLLVIIGAILNFLSPNVTSLQNKYQTIIWIGSFSNFIGGTAGLIALFMTAIFEKKNGIIYAMTGLVLLILVPDFVHLYLEKFNSQAAWVGLAMTCSMIAVIYGTIWYRLKHRSTLSA